MFSCNLTYASRFKIMGCVSATFKLCSLGLNIFLLRFDWEDESFIAWIAFSFQFLHAARAFLRTWWRGGCRLAAAKGICRILSVSSPPYVWDLGKAFSSSGCSQIHWSVAELNEIMSRGGNKALTRRWWRVLVEIGPYSRKFQYIYILKQLLCTKGRWDSQTQAAPKLLNLLWSDDILRTLLQSFYWPSPGFETTCCRLENLLPLHKWSWVLLEGLCCHRFCHIT